MNSPTCHCPKEKGLPYCDKVKKWIFYITTRKERSFTLSDSEKIYQVYYNIYIYIYSISERNH